MCRMGKSRAESCLRLGGGGGKWGVTIKGYGVSLRSDENVPKLSVVTAADRSSMHHYNPATCLL